MTLTIGRAGRDSPSTMSIQTDAVRLDGNKLTLAGALIGQTEQDVLLLRQQILGLSDSPDEPVVPIIHSGDATVTGFYRVESTSVDSSHSGADQLGGVLHWAGTFERISGFGSPQIETIATFPVLTNGVGVTGAEIAAVTAHDLWFPESVTEISHVLGTAVVRTADTGDLFQVVATDSPPSLDTVRWSLSPADYYDTAVTLQVGSSFRTFVGRQLEYSVVSSTLDDWRINNGLVRVSWDTSDDTLVVQHFDGAVWETAKKYNVWLGDGANIVDGIIAARVLMNTPERVTMRLGLTSSTDPQTLVSVDLTVLRGERMVRITFTSQNVVIWAIRRTPDEAGTDTSAVAPFSFAAGLRATANDAGGNRYVIACAALSDKELVPGEVSTSAPATTALFMVSTEIGGSGAAAYDTAERQILSFLAGTNEQQIVSVR